MKIKEYKFNLKLTDFDNEKWEEVIPIKAVVLSQATKELWNTLSEYLSLNDLASVTITNLRDLKVIDRY